MLRVNPGNQILLLGATMAALAFAPAMQAAAIVETTNSNSCVLVANDDCEVVLFDAASPGNPLFGETAQTHTQVAFASSNGLLEGKPGGTISAVSGSFSNLTIRVPGYYFTELLFQITAGSATTVMIEAGSGNGSMPEALQPAAMERIRIAATGDELIQSVTFNSVGPITDVRHIKVGGLERANVPEPGSLLISGVGLFILGAVGRSRFRRGE